MNAIHLAPRFVITLTNVPQRMENAKQAPEFRIFPAFDLRAWKVSFTTKPRYACSSAELGCLISHLSVLRAAQANQYTAVIIAEDDTVFHPSFPDAQYVPDDWQLLYFGTWVHWSDQAPQEKVIENVYRSVPAMGAHAYAIRSDIYDLIINEALYPTPIPIDLALANLVRSNSIRAYTLMPFVARQQSIMSQITASKAFAPLRLCMKLFKTNA